VRGIRGAAIVLMAALAGCGTSADPQPAEQTSPVVVPAPSLSTPPSSPSGISAHPAEVPTAAATATPERLVITAVGVDVPVIAVGVANDGQMALPPDPARIGWYRFGPRPGARSGSVVLGGHLDSKQYGVGPLVRLRKLRPGDRITVRSTDDSTKTYRVRKLQDIPKATLNVADIFDRGGPSQLRIVTCGGPYNPDAGGYRDNLVVTATPS